MNLEKLKLGMTVRGDSGNDPKTPPDWMDMERFQRGQQFFQRHLAASAFALHCSLTVGFGVANLVEPLAYTKKSDTAPKALSRYTKTYVHIVMWHLEDVWDVNTQAHKSTQAVRRMHNHVRKNMESDNPAKGYVTQYDMALVQSGFFGAVALYPSHFGVVCTKQELEDYVFFWRGIGYLLGIKDEFNSCSGSYDETYRLCKEVEVQIVYRGLLEPPPAFETLINAYIGGVNIMHKFQMFTASSIIAFSISATDLSLPNLKLSWADWLRVGWFKFNIFMIRWLPFFERFNNYLSMRLYRRILSDKKKELAAEGAAV